MIESEDTHVAVSDAVSDEARERFLDAELGDYEPVYVSSWYQKGNLLYVEVGGQLPDDGPDDPLHDIEYRVEVSADGQSIVRDYVFDVENDKELVVEASDQDDEGEPCKG